MLYGKRKTELSTEKPLFNEIISKAVIDENFRNDLFNNPAKVAESFNVSNEELAELQNLDFTELKERISKTFIALPLESEDKEYHSSSHTDHR